MLGAWYDDLFHCMHSEACDSVVLCCIVVCRTVVCCAVLSIDIVGIFDVPYELV